MTDAPSSRCFHCGEPVPAGADWSIEFDGLSRSCCCGGCRAVARTIIDAGLGAFYRQRSSLGGATAAARELDQALAEARRLGSAATAVDASTGSREAPTPGGASPADRQSLVTETDLAIEGMHCGACVWLIEQGLAAEPGVVRVGVNLATERATLSWSPAQTSLARLLEVVARLGYRARPFNARTRERELAAYSRRSLQRLFVAGLGMMQVMMYALPGYLSGDDAIETEYVQLLRWAAFILTTPVVLYSAWPFFQGAWQSLRHRRIGMDVPVSIGLLAAYLASVVATITGHGEVYFDSVAMFTFLLLLARHLQWMIRRRALAQIDAIGAATPDAVWRLTEDGRELVTPAALSPADRIEVETGQTVPADASLITGTTTIDQSVLTGESLPVSVRAGDSVAAGSVVTGPPARLIVARCAADSAVSRIEALVARGLSDKPRWALLADRIATVFVAIVLLLAAATWFAWMQLDPSRAWPIAMTILVVSCPCALSLATPSALTAATGALMREGILVTRADAMEALAGITDIVFDKTGTLTTGTPTVTAIDTDPCLSAGLALQLAGAMEQGISHPFAQALRTQAAISAAPGSPGLTIIEHCAGRGVSARWQSGEGGEQILRLGSAGWCGLDEAARNRWPADDAASEVFLVAGQFGDRRLEQTNTGATDSDDIPFSPHTVLARFSLTDPLRAGAAAAVAALQARGIEVHLLLGRSSGSGCRRGPSAGCGPFRGGRLAAGQAGGRKADAGRGPSGRHGWRRHERCPGALTGQCVDRNGSGQRSGAHGRRCDPAQA